MEIVRSNDTVNLTQLEFREEKPNLSIAPPIVILILNTVGNSLALILLHRLSGEHKWRIFYRFVLALTINDLLGIILTVPVGIARYASNFTYTLPPSLCDFVAFVQMFTILNSAFIVFSMSLDRFLAILFPVKYSFSAKERRAHTLLILGGIVSLLVSSALHMVGRHARRFYPGSWCFVDFSSESWADRGISLVYALTGLIILFLVTVLNIAVIVTIFRQIFSKGNSRKRNTSSKKSTQTIFLLFSVVILFAICSVPLLVRTHIYHNQLHVYLVFDDAYFKNIFAYYRPPGGGRLYEKKDPSVYAFLRTFFILSFEKKVTMKMYKSEFSIG